MAVHTLHGKHGAAPVQIPLTRLEALKFFTKWSRTAQRHSRKGHRTLYLMEVHKGFLCDKLVIETVQAKQRVRKHIAWKAPS